MHKISEFINEMNAYEGETVVIKIGGEPIVQAGFLQSLAVQLRTLQKFDARIVLVHGAGPQIKKALTDHGITRRRHDNGRWRTTAEELAVVKSTMEQVNCLVATAFMQEGCRLFSVAASGCCLVHAQPMNGTPLDFTGMPTGVDTDKLIPILQKGQIYVTHSIGTSKENGSFLNVNADDYAMALAVSLKAKRLVLATDTDGVLDAQKNTILEITPELAEKLKQNGTIKDGMVVKVDSAIDAVKKGIGGVAIVNAFRENSILIELGTKEGERIGTLITARSPHSALVF